MLQYTRGVWNSNGLARVGNASLITSDVTLDHTAGITQMNKIVVKILLSPKFKTILVTGRFYIFKNVQSVFSVKFLPV